MSFIKRSQLDLDSVIYNKEAIWLHAELFLGHHDASCHGLWWFVVIHVMLCEGFCHGSWWFMSWFVVICSDLWFVVIHVMLNLWWFIVICDDSCHHLWWSMSWFVVVCGSSVKNSLRHWPKHAFLVKTWVVIPYSNRLEKLTLLREGFVQICREFTEILTEMCSFSQNMRLLPLIPIVSKS